MKDIFILTNSFPYNETGESFLSPEIKVVADLSVNIHIVPTHKDKTVRSLPPNIKILAAITDISIFFKIIAILKMILNSKFWFMYYKERSSITKIKNIFQGIKYYYGACLTEQYLIKNKSKFPVGCTLYSYWFTYAAIGIAFAKKNHPHYRKSICVSRAHGFDVFDDERNIFIPLRQYCLNYLDCIFSVSKTGAEHLISRFPDYSKKIETSYLGILPIETRKSQKNFDISFVSCSSFVKIKRVDLIYATIVKYCEKCPHLNVKWLHIGDGANRKKLNEIIDSTKPFNLTVEIPGFLSQDEIFAIYSKTDFDSFLNFSVTEGIPVSIMEAIAAEIPVIATDVGGTNEIVCEQTGVLIPVNFDQTCFENAIETIMSRKADLNLSTKQYFEENFEAYNNYKKFYNRILELKNVEIES